MKKFSFLLFALFLLFSMCSKKVKENPIIVFNNGDSVVFVSSGDKKDVLLNVNAPGRLSEISYSWRTLKDTEKIAMGDPIVTFSNPKRYSQKLLLEGKPEDYVLFVEVKDKDNKVSVGQLLVRSFQDTIKASSYSESTASTSSTPSFVSEVKYQETLSDIPSHKIGTYVAGFNKNIMGSSLSVNTFNNTGTIKKLHAAKTSVVDLMFFYGKNNAVTVTSPSNDLAGKVFNNAENGVQTWNTKNTTYLALLKSSKSFESITIDDANATLDNAPEKTALNFLKEGDIVIFQTISGAIGALTIRYTGKGDRGLVSFDLKVLGKVDEVSQNANTSAPAVSSTKQNTKEEEQVDEDYEDYEENYEDYEENYEEGDAEEGTTQEGADENVKKEGTGEDVKQGSAVGEDVKQGSAVGEDVKQGSAVGEDVKQGSATGNVQKVVE